MKVLRKITGLVLALSFLAAAYTPYAQATTLPVSTYATAQQNWQGSKFYSATANDGSTLSCRVDYAVYDTSGPQSAAETTFFASVKSVMPDMAKYLYVYQVFNDLSASATSSASSAPVASFDVHNLNNTAMNILSQNIGSADDATGGVQPSDNSLGAGGTKAIWNFAGNSLILQTQHSWFLVLSSNGAPVKGTYEISSSTSDQPVPPPIPEPATIALISLGGLIITRWRIRR